MKKILGAFAYFVIVLLAAHGIAWVFDQDPDRVKLNILLAAVGSLTVQFWSHRHKEEE